MKTVITLLITTLSLLAGTSTDNHIKLQLLWTHQFEFAGFYMAKEKGYYKDVGLEVEIIDGFRKNTIEDVDIGKVDFGVAGSKIIYEAINGKKLIALASIFQSSPFAWLARKDSNIKTLHDFSGKTVMHAEHSLDNIELLAILKARGVEKSTINFIPTTYNIQDLIDKKCDVVSAYVSNEPYDLEKAGVEYVLFNPVEYGVDFYGDILFTSQKFLAENPETVKSFREASLKGWKYAFDNIEETINLINSKYNPSLSLGHLRYEANMLKKQSLYPFVAIGTMDRERWKNIAQTFKDLGYLESSVLPENFIYDEDKNKMSDMVLKWVFIVIATLFVVSFVILFLVRKHNKYMNKLVEEKTNSLEIQKKNYETFFSQAVYGILIIQDGKFVKANSAAAHMLKYDSEEEVLNLYPSELSPKFQPDGQLSEDKQWTLINKCLKEGSIRFEWMHVKKDAQEFWVDVALNMITFDEKESILATWRDISRQKALEEHLEREVMDRTEELEHAMRTKSDFLANMSHEIRTPLNAIIGFVDILIKGETDLDKNKKLGIVKESGYSLMTIINDILDFSKIENNKLLIEKIPLNIVEMFEYVVELFFDKAKERNVNIRLTIDDRLPNYILGDIVRIKQVLSNLISNAIKFADKDSTVDVKVDYLHETKELYCEVRDYGVVIDNGKIVDIFKAFVQEDSSTTRKYGGTGLGLSISKALVNLMGGEIGARSENCVATVFYFTLPIVESKDNLDKLEINTESIKRMQGNVLIVEDNKSNQLLMTILLDELGLDSDIANDGVEALKVMQKDNHYDLILMDENMPNMNGIEATKHIRMLNKCRNIPIVAVTANALKGDKEKFLEAGMNDYISKPIDNKKLEEVLRKYL